MLTATYRKTSDGYYKACLIVNDTGKVYKSTDVFLNIHTAKKQAKWWKSESLEMGVVIDF